MSLKRLDETDQKILAILKKDARRSYVQIGKMVGLSEAAVRRRIQNLVRDGVIKRFTIEAVTEEAANALTLISTHPSTSIPKVAERLLEVKGVETVYEITGQYDVAVIISAPNIADVNRCVDEIRREKGVATTNTIIILRILR